MKKIIICALLFAFGIATVLADTQSSRVLFVDAANGYEPWYAAQGWYQPDDIGSKEHPYASIQSAIDYSVPNGVILVSAGDYRAISITNHAVTIIATGDVRIGADYSSAQKSSVYISSNVCGFVITGFVIHSGDGTPRIDEWGYEGNRCGGAVYCQGSGRFENCKFNVYGGYAHADPYCGGALYFDGTGVGLDIELSNCLITGNTAQQGGAIAMEKRDPWNYETTCRVTMNHCTVADNKDTIGELLSEERIDSIGGVYVGDGTKLTVKNSILWNNDGFQLACSTTNGTNTSGSTVDISYACISGGSEALSSVGIAAGADVMSDDPCFTYGSYDLPEWSNCRQRGEYNHDGYGDRCDLGYSSSYESALFVTNTTDYLYEEVEDGVVVTNISANIGGDVVLPMMIDGKLIVGYRGDGSWGWSGTAKCVFENPTNVTSLVFPSGVMFLDQNAFIGCSRMTSVTLPTSLEWIGYEAFASCSSLSTLTLPEGVTNVSMYAFQYCENLGEVRIPSTLQSLTIGYGDSPVMWFTVSEDNPWYSSDSAGSLFNKDKTVLYRCASNNGYDDYWRWAQMLFDYHLPDTIECIESYAFSGLKPGYIIRGTIPASVTKIHYNAFCGCQNVEMNISGDNPYYMSINGEMIYSKDGKTLVSYFGSASSVPMGSVTNVEYMAIADNSSVRYASFPDSLTNLGMYNFIRCDHLQEMILPKNVENIYGLGYGCPSLKRVVMPVGAKTKIIDQMSFYQCSNLTEVVFAEGLEKIGSGYCFYQCVSLPEITIPESVTQYGGFRECTALTNVAFRGSVPKTSSYNVDMANPNRIGYYRPKYAAEWQAALDAEGKWYGMPMQERAMTNVVKFVVGEHGSLKSGNLTQVVLDEEYAVAPEMTADENWVFMGWEPKVEETAINSDTTFTAVWKYGWWNAMEVKPDGTVTTNTVWYGDSVAYKSPEPSVVGGGRTQIVYLGSSITAPIVTNDFSLVVTGDVSFAWDVRATNYWLSVNTASHGTIEGAVSGWQADGATVTLTAVPDEHYHFIGWTGDVADAAVNGAEVTVTMDKARIIGATFELDIGMAVNAPDLDWSTSGAAGWDGRNATTAADGVHAAHAGTIGDNAESVLTLELSGQGVLGFSWRVSCEEKYDALRLVVDGKTVRSITGETTWAEESLTLGFGDHVVQWIYKKGRSNKAGEDTAWLDKVTWSALPDPTLGDALSTNLTWRTEGDIAWEAVRTEYAYEGGICAMAEDLGDYESASIKTTVTGAGRISFYWGVSCEEGYDWLDFIVDGKVMASITGEEDWTKTFVDLGDGEHTLEWRYWKDEMDDPTLVGANCAMLDAVTWTAQYEVPPELGTKHLDAFYTWLRDHNQIEAGATMAKALAVGLGSGASGKSCSLMSDFIAGTDPNDEDDVFTATIVFEDGVPVVKWSPELPEAQTAMRSYKVWGKTSLNDAEWTDVSNMSGESRQSAGYLFFKVSVEMK